MIEARIIQETIVTGNIFSIYLLFDKILMVKSGNYKLLVTITTERTFFYIHIEILAPGS